MTKPRFPNYREVARSICGQQWIDSGAKSKLERQIIKALVDERMACHEVVFRHVTSGGSVFDALHEISDRGVINDRYISTNPHPPQAFQARHIHRNPQPSQGRCTGHAKG